MGKAVGIDLGTTHSCIAYIEDGKPVLVPNSNGDRLTPSVVCYLPNGEILVGKQARHEGILHPEWTIASVKRFIGLGFAEIHSEVASLSMPAYAGPHDQVRFRIHDYDLSPEEVSAAILRQLVDDASAQLGEDITDAVITVPAYFNDSQRNATKDAGELAGLNVLRIINEPTAAALAYGLDKRESGRVLVYDFGGGTLDVTLLDIDSQVCEVIGTSGDTHLGGQDFDKAILKHLTDQLETKFGYKLADDRKVLDKIIEAADKAKAELSWKEDSICDLAFVEQGELLKHISLSITRDEFVALSKELLERARLPIRKVFADSNCDPEAIDRVLLVGGSTRIPAVQELVFEETKEREMIYYLNPDEVVALGAAVQAGILKGEVHDMVLLDVTPHSLGIQVAEDKVHRLITRNTPLPASATDLFTTYNNFQRGVDVVILQGESTKASQNRVLGSFGLEGLKARAKGDPLIEIVFELNENGILQVSARDVETGVSESVSIENSTNLGKEEKLRLVEDQRVAGEKRMLRRQEQHREARAIMRAKEVIRQTEVILEALPELTSPKIKSTIEQISSLKSALVERASAEKLDKLTIKLEERKASLEVNKEDNLE